MVFEETITIECFLGGLTIAINGFTMVFLCCYHRFQWFSMVPDHWSNDAMVSMDRCGLVLVQRHRYLHQNVKTDVEVSTVNKLVGEKSPNLFFLSWIEDQGALRNKILCLMTYSENRHNFRKLT